MSMEDATPEVSNDLESQINAIKGGQPISNNDHTFFEQRFGNDFSHVRFHADTRAAETVREVNTRTFTIDQDFIIGSNINFNSI